MINVLKEWWDKLCVIGPALGYFPNASKTWLVVKEEFVNLARDIFHDTGVNITMDGTSRDPSDEGRQYLGAAVGTDAFGCM